MEMVQMLGSDKGLVKVLPASLPPMCHACVLMWLLGGRTGLTYWMLLGCYALTVSLLHPLCDMLCRCAGRV